MAEYNLGRVAFFDKGAYSPEDTYNKWDFVTTVDSTYLFIGTTPQIGKPVTDTNFWKCIADGKPATLAAAAADLAKEAANSSATLANEKAALAQSAATLANTKAGLANDAAVLATEKAALADSKATLANDKAVLAQSAADNANTKAGLADAASILATDKAGLADSKATLANDKAVLAQTAADNANTKAGLANNATIAANDAAIAANSAATLATDKAALADSKATLANDKAVLAQSAADNANAKAAEVTAAVLSAGQLGSIKTTDAAPTPARNGNYTFSIGGNKPAWLTAEAGITTVKAGDGVAVVYTAPSSYTYTHVNVSDELVQLGADLNQTDKAVRDNNIISDTENIIVSDSAGNVLIEISKDGFIASIIRCTTLNVDNIDSFFDKLNISYIKQIINNDSEIAYTDDAGYIVAKINNEGVKSIENKSIIDANFPADINMIIGYGQSLSVYGGAGSLSDDDIPSNIVMFQNGIAVDLYNPVDGTYNSASITEADYYGNTFVPLTKTTYQRSLAALMKMIDVLLLRENNYSSYSEMPYLIGVTCGKSGAGVDELSVKTANPYLRILKSVENGKKLAANQNKSFAVPILTYMQGEGNYANTLNYVTKLVSLFNSINTDIKAITGQSNDVQFVVYQPATQVDTQVGDGQNIIALDFLEAIKNNANIHFGCAMYQFNYGVDELHAASDYSYDEIGALMGVQAKKIICDSSPISPIVPLSSYYVAQTGGTYKIFVKYKVDFPPLKFSNYASIVPNPNSSAILNYGFSLKSGATELITEVDIINKDTVMVTCSANPAGLDLTYAWSGKLGGGNLTDSYEKEYRPSKAMPAQRFKLYNFAPINKITF